MQQHFSCGLTATVSKTSSGALELTDIYSVPDLAEFLLVCMSYLDLIHDLIVQTRNNITN